MFSLKKPLLVWGVVISLVAALAVGGSFPPRAAGAATGQLEALATRAANFLYNEFMQGNIRNSEFGVGPYAAYVLTQAGVDVAAWVSEGTSLKETVVQMIYGDLQEPSKVSAKQLAQDLVAARALQRPDLAAELCRVLTAREGPGGLDTGDYALCSSVAAYELLGRAGCISEFVYGRDYLLNTQNLSVGEAAYGSWGGAWGPDFMATAQAVRALAWLDPGKEDQESQHRIALGLAWLKNQQQADGSFVASGWDDPLVNTVEMVATLLAVGEDPSLLKSVSGNSPVDYLRTRALREDGSFGALGNAWDATWALYSCTVLGARTLPISLSPPGATLKVGEALQLQAWLEDEAGDRHEITNGATWVTREPTVASVVYGLVTGLQPGSTVISATYEGLTGSAAITVLPAAGGPGGPATCRVGVAVVGKNGELLFGPGYVELAEGGTWGLTALGALDATGLPYRVSSQYEGFVEEIAGQANQGWSGWCYAVNDTPPTVAAHQCRLADGDRVVWYYSQDFSTPVPRWEDLVKQQSAETSSAAEALSVVEKALSDLREGSSTPGRTVSRLGEILAPLKPDQVTAELRTKLGEAAQLLAAALARVPENALAVEERGQKIILNVHLQRLKEHLGTLKAAAEVAEMLKGLGIEEAAGLAQADLTVQVPETMAGAGQVSAVFPAEAAKEAAEAKLALVLKRDDVALKIPPRALKALIEAGPEVAQVEVSAGRVEAEKVELFDAARLVTPKAFDLEACGLTPDGRREKPETFPEDLVIAFALEGVDLEGLDPSRLAVYRQRGEGDWEFVGGHLDPDIRSFVCPSPRLSLFALAEFMGTFRDVEGHWAREAIELLARRLVVRGVAADRFAPEETVTRAQFAAFLVRALGMEERPAVRPVFQDLPDGHWARGAVEAAYQAGLVLGSGGGRFEPERPITREEVAALLARVLNQYGLASPAHTPSAAQVLGGYHDWEAVSPWAREAVAAGVKSGLLKGRSATELAPRGPSTRAEAAVLIADLLRFLGRI